jgi:hypothetical protein
MTKPTAPALLLALAAAAALAGCATVNEGPPLDPAPAAESEAPPPARGERVFTAREEEGPPTMEKARAQCWMRYEKDKSAKNLDAKLALVNKCVAERMRGR